MKVLTLMSMTFALMPVANAERGDAEDRALTHQMMKQTDAHAHANTREGGLR